MAITFAPEFFSPDRRKRYLFFALGGAAAAAVGILAFRFFPFDVASSLLREPQPPIPRSIEIDFGVLETPGFLRLGQPPPPVEPPETVGRTNPFLPLR